ncbi:MAG TPA: GNAT family N-acetyltransferase [Solirubrobacteraceae bacterium]|nr:GNAT family N-acetyltransferase [Solirubrobacteraceae bacterium]
MDLRVARHTARLRDVVAFYRDGVGLPELGGFKDHAGYDGVFLDVPGTGTHLEFTTGGVHGPPPPDPESLLVLYVGCEDVVADILRRLRVDPVEPANPYWAEHGVTVEDPDGFRVVLVPERWERTRVRDVRVKEHAGPRAELRPLFELAEDSARELDTYIDAGRVLVASDSGRIIGHVQLVETGRLRETEVKNMAVEPSAQGRGIGRALLAAAVALARDEGYVTLTVATAAADVGNLRFYQRLGFRMRAIERDAFTPATGYAVGAMIDGVELRDRVWLERRLDA